MRTRSCPSLTLWAWQKSVREDLGLSANVCQTYATIAENNGTHRAHFVEQDNYDKFYDYVCCIMRCALKEPGH